MSETYAPHEFQYESAPHQHGTALAGMWLFLATEMLFFGGLFLAWIFARYQNLDGFDAGARETELWIGSLNTVILLTGSFVYATGLAFARIGDNRRLAWCCLGAIALGVAFLALKFGVEWHVDFTKHLFPADPEFRIGRTGAGGARLFFTFYFLGTALHGVHLVGGIGLVAMVAWQARQGRFSASYITPVEVVGLYWSFVDMIWIFLYPLIYLVGRS